jgi:RNA polymerase sigma-70 factor (ECF subfamily)
MPQQPPMHPLDGDRTTATSLTLLQRARAGDADAWRKLVKLYTPLVYHWCGRWNVRGADADDVLQEVFHSASVSLSNFRRDRAGDTFRGWLRGIARNKLQDLNRRRTAEPPGAGGSSVHERLEAIPGDTTAPGQSGSDDPDDSKVLSSLFQTTLQEVRGQFDERTWRAFWRTTVDGQRPVDIAGELGLSPAAVRMAKSRVLRRVREELGDLIED